MNTIVYGAVGSGKTFYCVENFLLPALMKSRPVYTNIDFGFKKGFQWLQQHKIAMACNIDCRKTLFSKDMYEIRDLMLLDGLSEEFIKIPLRDT